MPLTRRVVLDLAALEFIDRPGIHLLIDAHHRAGTNGHQLVLTYVPAQAQRLFSLIAVNARIWRVPSRAGGTHWER